MLVLSRMEGERLVIGDNVVVTICRVGGKRVSVGIEAPRDLRIVRGELLPDDGRQSHPGSESRANRARQAG